jgi:ribosomal protein S18 acetylase RimI-like enzyme
MEVNMVRLFEQKDLERIMEIGNAAWRGIYCMFRECYGQELFEQLVPDEAEAKGMQIKAHGISHPEWIFVCEENERIVGFVTFLLDSEKKIGEICNNAVDPECGLKGIGQQMYNAVLNYFRNQGMVYARVFTGLDHAHAPARRAYERAGFNISHEEITYFQKL